MLYVLLSIYYVKIVYFDEYIVKMYIFYVYTSILFLCLVFKLKQTLR